LGVGIVLVVAKDVRSELQWLEGNAILLKQGPCQARGGESPTKECRTKDDIVLGWIKGPEVDFVFHSLLSLFLGWAVVVVAAVVAAAVVAASAAAAAAAAAAVVAATPAAALKGGDNDDEEDDGDQKPAARPTQTNHDEEHAATLKRRATNAIHSRRKRERRRNELQMLNQEHQQLGEEKAALEAEHARLTGLLRHAQQEVLSAERRSTSDR